MNKVNDLIRKTARELLPRAVDLRRSFHLYPETGWNEYRTASLIAEMLDQNGWKVSCGKELTGGAQRLGLPSEQKQNEEWERARQDGAPHSWLSLMKGGHTAVLGELSLGEGPMTVIRFDMDALPLKESRKKGHFPWDNVFSSVYPEVMHGCGHDGHAAAGALLSEALASLSRFYRGTLILLFQPAEEGVRGGSALKEYRGVKSADYLIGFHLLNSIPHGFVVPAIEGISATTKYDYFFTGREAHAGGDPAKGRDALLSASRAVVDIHERCSALTKAGRVHIGLLKGGSARNIIAGQAELSMESRGESETLNEYISQQAWHAACKAAEKEGCFIERVKRGESTVFQSHTALKEIFKKSIQNAGWRVYPASYSLGGSEDFSVLARENSIAGGKSLYFGVGAAGGGQPHSPDFDFNEKALETTLGVLLVLLADINGKKEKM